MSERRALCPSSPQCLSHVVVVVQLCVSDGGVEDLMESLTMETEKLSQEADGQHSIGPAADPLQGENHSNTSPVLSL